MVPELRVYRLGLKRLLGLLHAFRPFAMSVDVG